MAGRIVLFGATGYTGRLTAEALVERGAKPVLAARSAGKLAAMAGELGGLETAVADVSRPDSVAALVEKGDVMLSTVGPFVRWGGPAIEAAIAAGANYVDSTGETAFIREVFERYGPRAGRAGSALLTALGYDWVPGNLAGALVAERAGERATRVEIGYFMTGTGLGGMSGGTRASAAGAMSAPSFAWRGGRIVTERNAKRVRKFQVGSRELAGISVGSTEAFALPRAYPELREVGVYLGWFGPMSRPMQVFSTVMTGAEKVPGVTRAISAATAKLIKGSTGGPDAEARSKGGSLIVAVAYDESGNVLEQVRVEGIDGYTFTAKMLAWAAERAARPATIEASGALGPVNAFGLTELQAGVDDCGMTVK